MYPRMAALVASQIAAWLVDPAVRSTVGVVAGPRRGRRSVRVLWREEGYLILVTSQELWASWRSIAEG